MSEVIPDNVSSLPATTTHQEDLVTAGQRRINSVWEYTQSFIATLVVLANMIVGSYHGISSNHGPYPDILSWSLALIVGFYFSRTNHAAIGGVGRKPEDSYRGR